MSSSIDTNTTVFKAATLPSTPCSQRYTCGEIDVQGETTNAISPHNRNASLANAAIMTGINPMVTLSAEDLRYVFLKNPLILETSRATPPGDGGARAVATLPAVPLRGVTGIWP
jgi:hypothetical protein